MIKLVKEVKARTVVFMKEMEPMEVGIIVDPDSHYYGNYVARTPSVLSPQWLDLTEIGSGKCWSGKPDILVELLPKGDKITLELYNE